MKLKDAGMESGENAGEADAEGWRGGGGGSGGGLGLNWRLLLVEGGGGPAQGRKSKVGIDCRKPATPHVFCQRSSGVPCIGRDGMYCEDAHYIQDRGR